MNPVPHSPREVIEGLLATCQIFGRRYQVPAADVFCALLAVITGLSDRRAAFDRWGNGRVCRANLPVTLICDSSPVWLDRMLFGVRDAQSHISKHCQGQMWASDLLAPSRKKVLREIRQLEAFGSLFAREAEDRRQMAYSRRAYSRHLVLHDVAVGGGRLPADARAMSNSLLILALGDSAIARLHRHAGDKRSIWSKLGKGSPPRLHFLGQASGSFLRTTQRRAPRELPKYGWMFPVSAGAALPDGEEVNSLLIDNLVRRAAVDHMVALPQLLKPSEAIRTLIDQMVAKQMKEAEQMPACIRSLATPSADLAWQALAAVHRIVSLLSKVPTQETREIVDLALIVADHIHRHHLHTIRLTFPGVGDGMLGVEECRVLEHLRRGPLSVRDLMRKSRNKTTGMIASYLGELEKAGVVLSDGGVWRVVPMPTTRLSEMGVG
jgi:hypothetical protein